MQLLRNFKNFAFGGNLIELAVGLALALAFEQVVSSLVENVILPLVAAIFGEPNFDRFTLTIGDGVITYGSFLTTLVSFLLLAFVLMLLVRAVTRVTGREIAGVQGLRDCDHCKEWIAVDASVCKFCTRDVVPVVGE